MKKIDDNVEEVKEPVVTPETPEAPQAPETPKEDAATGKKGRKAAKDAKPEMSATVDHALKLHPDHKQLYVSKHGGTYTVDTPEFIRGNAVLYDNPYYTK